MAEAASTPSTSDMSDAGIFNITMPSALRVSLAEWLGSKGLAMAMVPTSLDDQETNGTSWIIVASYTSTREGWEELE